MASRQESVRRGLGIQILPPDKEFLRFADGQPQLDWDSVGKWTARRSHCRAVGLRSPPRRIVTCWLFSKQFRIRFVGVPGPEPEPATPRHLLDYGANIFAPNFTSGFRATPSPLFSIGGLPCTWPSEGRVFECWPIVSATRFFLYYPNWRRQARCAFCFDQQFHAIAIRPSPVTSSQRVRRCYPTARPVGT
jgi:hypothetical protein